MNDKFDEFEPIRRSHRDIDAGKDRRVVYYYTTRPDTPLLDFIEVFLTIAFFGFLVWMMVG